MKVVDSTPFAHRITNSYDVFRQNASFTQRLSDKFFSHCVVQSHISPSLLKGGRRWHCKTLKDLTIAETIFSCYLHIPSDSALYSILLMFIIHM